MPIPNVRNVLSNSNVEQTQGFITTPQNNNGNVPVVNGAIRITIPAGTTLLLFDFVEIVITTPVSLIIRFPVFSNANINLGTLLGSIRQAGGNVEILKDQNGM